MKILTRKRQRRIRKFLGLPSNEHQMRRKRGMRPLGAWVSKELAEKLDAARGDIPMTRYVLRVLEREMDRLAAHGAAVEKMREVAG